MKNKCVDIIKSFCLILSVLGIVSSTLYNGNNTLFINIMDYITKPFVYPVILFILGYIEYNSDKEFLLKKALYSFIIGLFINVFCFALIFYLREESYLLLENLFRVNIFIFISLMYLFIYCVKNYEIDDYTLWGVGLFFSILNTLLTFKNSLVDSNVVIESLTSIVYSSSNHMSFSFLPWIIFPITGYLFNELSKDKNDNFYLLTGIFSSSIFVILTTFSKLSVIGSNLIDYDNVYTFYHMNIYNAITNISLCIFIFTLVYLISKNIPSKIYRHIKRWSKNIVILYIVSLIITNYGFYILLDGMVTLDGIQTLLLFIIIFIISDVISRFIGLKINESK